MKIAFFGTGDFSANILSTLLKKHQKEIQTQLIVSQPDKQVGRKKIKEATPVKQVASENEIYVLQPEKLKNNLDFFEKLKHEALDFIVVVAYGKIIPKEILDIPKYGCINIHGSILPQYRGASPIQASIKNGDSHTGLTIMYMSEGMDEGDILATEEVKIDKNDTTLDIFEKFTQIGPKLLIETLQKIVDGMIKSKKQDDTLATYCGKISKQDGEINFLTQTGKQIYDMFRAYYKWPGIYSYYNGKKLNIEECVFEEGDFIRDTGIKVGDLTLLGPHSKEKKVGIVCQDGLLMVKQIKLEGKKSMDILSFINGNKEFINYNFITHE